MISVVTERTVSDPLGFNGWMSAAVSITVAVSVAAVWTSLGLTRLAAVAETASSPMDVLFGRPHSGRLSVKRLVPFAALVLAAYAVARVSGVVDWDFLLLKSGLFA